MGRIEERLDELGRELLPEIVVPEGVVLTVRFVNAREDGAIVSGHGPQAPAGQISGAFG